MPNWRTRCTSPTSARAGALHDARPVASPTDINALRSIIFGVLHLWFVWPFDSCPSLKLTIGWLMAARHTSVWARPLVLRVALCCIDEATQVRPRFGRIHNFLDARTPPAVRNGEVTARSSALVRTEVTEAALAYQFGISYDP